jgi:hypothetical protein
MYLHSNDYENCDKTTLFSHLLPVYPDYSRAIFYQFNYAKHLAEFKPNQE